MRIIAGIGTVIGVFLNLSPVVLFYEIYKKKRVYTEIPEMMFVMGVFCGLLNTAYGILIRDTNIILSSAIGSILQIIYSTIYLYLLSKGKIFTWLLYLFIAYNLSLEVLYFFSNVLDYNISNAVAQEITGWLNVFIGVINAGAPGQKIMTVWKTCNYKLIPIVTTVCQFACSLTWAIYGLFKLDLKIIIPNVLGVLLTLGQIFVYLYAYNKMKGKIMPNTTPQDPNGDKYEDENDFNDEEKENKEEENMEALIKNKVNEGEVNEVPDEGGD